MPCSDFMGMESVVKLKVVSLHLNHGNWPFKKFSGVEL